VLAPKCEWCWHLSVSGAGTQV